MTYLIFSSIRLLNDNASTAKELGTRSKPSESKHLELSSARRIFRYYFSIHQERLKNTKARHSG
jgi:hypothetical protein